MGMVPYTNETDKFQHIGSATIPPGDTRLVDEELLPGYQPPADVPAGGNDGGGAKMPDDAAALMLAAMLELLEKNVPEIQAQLAALTDDELEILEKGESAAEGKNRSTLLQSISTEKLARAANAK